MRMRATGLFPRLPASSVSWVCFVVLLLLLLAQQRWRRLPSREYLGFWGLTDSESSKRTRARRKPEARAGATRDVLLCQGRTTAVRCTKSIPYSSVWLAQVMSICGSNSDRAWAAWLAQHRQLRAAEGG